VSLNNDGSVRRIVDPNAKGNLFSLDADSNVALGNGSVFINEVIRNVFGGAYAVAGERSGRYATITAPATGPCRVFTRAVR
jgi:hypothetical protein